jgi:hypothetical protein
MKQLKLTPLLSHYERLALKAAIDHARSEGATKIAISDAETAMMTEGHDIHHRGVNSTMNPRLEVDTNKEVGPRMNEAYAKQKEVTEYIRSQGYRYEMTI